MRTVKIRVYPTKKQISALKMQMSEHKELWNACLQERIDLYQKFKTSTSWQNQATTLLPKFKNVANYSSMQHTVRRLDKAFQAFFRRIKSGEKPGFPRFKTSVFSMEYTWKDGIGIKDGKIRIFNVGLIKAKFHLPIGKATPVKYAVVKFSNGKYYVSFMINEVITRNYPKTGKKIGIDLGVKTFCATSDGEITDNPRYSKELSKKLKKVTQQLKKQKDDLSVKPSEKHRTLKKHWKIHDKIKNRRMDFHHKKANELLGKYDIIFVEDLSIQSMSQDTFRQISSGIYDSGWGTFVQILDYKAESAGKRVIKVNPAYTSQICSDCGKMVRKELKDRIHSCQCGCVLDRDINAAKNILAVGLHSLQT